MYKVIPILFTSRTSGSKIGHLAHKRIAPDAAVNVFSGY